VLLTWRDDPYFGSGWHVPGSALRFQETMLDRLHQCAQEELGATVQPEPEPFTLVEEIQAGRRTRGHNVSAAFRCRLLSGPDPARAYVAGAPQAGQWAWHATCPPDLLPVHRVYERHFPSV
jgi:colanic acid biosynthesis protein WcaH